jgi:hypothetical protein
MVVEQGVVQMRASGEKLFNSVGAVPARSVSRPARISLTSPLFAYAGAAAGSVAVWFGVFKMIFG